MPVTGTSFDYGRSIAIDVCGSATVAIAINNNSKRADGCIGLAAPWTAFPWPPWPCAACFNVSITAGFRVDQHRLDHAINITDRKGRVRHATIIGADRNSLQHTGAAHM